MAKKSPSKDVKVGDPQAATPPQAAAPAPAGGLAAALAAMKKGGAKAEVTKSSKSGVVSVEVDEPDIASAMKTFILEDAKLKAAESRKKSAGETLKEWAETRWFKLVRDGQQFLKTISLKGDINFGSGKLVVGKPNAEANPPLTKEGIDCGLQSVFTKEEYQKYVKSTLVLQVAEEYANENGVGLLMTRLNSPIYAPAKFTDKKAAIAAFKKSSEYFLKALNALPETKDAAFEVEIMQPQPADNFVGETAELFSRVFPSFDVNIELRKDKPGDDGIVELKRDMALFPAIEKKVEAAMEKGLIAKWSGALTSQKNALAVAQEEILAEAKAIDEAKQKGLIIVAAAAAGAAAAQHQKAS